MSNLLKSKFLLGVVVVSVMLVGLLGTFVVTKIASAADCSITATLRVGSRGAEVTCLQNNLGVSPATGYFGSKTKAAVVAFQSNKGLTADGVFGPKSLVAWSGGATTSSSGPLCPNGMTLASNCISSPNAVVSSGPLCPNGMTLASNCTTSPSSQVSASGPVSVMLSSDNPAASTLVAGQATADLAHFTFTGSGTVTGVTLQRIGVSSDSTAANIYLFDGATRLTDAASVSNNGMVTFNVPSGIFTVNGSKNIAVKSDIADSTSGQTVGFKLTSFTTASGAANTSLSGNIHTIASSTLAAITLSGTVTPTGATINPASGITLWQATMSVNQRDVWMKRMALRQVGSAPSTAFQNFKLYVNGVQVGTSASLDSMGYVTFDLNAAPVLLVSGSRVVRVDADIVSGASRTVQLSLRQAADVDLVDSSFGVNIRPGLTGTALPWAAATANTISGTSGGTMTVEKDISSPSTNVTLTGSDVNLGTFKLTAYGEAIKVETLKAGFTFTDGGTANAAATLRNGRLLISGVQYGSTATLLAAGTSFTTNYTIYPGTPVMVEVHADIYDNDGTGSLDTADTLRATLVTGSSNAQRVDSLGSFNVPSANVNANTLAIASAAITLTKNGTYPNQTTTLPTTNLKIGSWNLAGSSVENVLLTTLSFDIRESTGTEFDEGDITNMYVVVKNSSGAIVAQPSPIATLGTGADQNYSINYTLVKNASVTIELFANLTDDGLDMVAGVSGGSDAIDNTDAFDTVLQVSGTSLISGQTVTGGNGSTTVSGQAIAKGATTITATVDGSSPVAAVAYDNQTVTSLALKFAAVTSAFNITDLTFTLPAAGATVVSTVSLWDGSTLVGSQPGGTTTVTFAGLNWNVPANTNRVLTVKLDLGTVGFGAGTTGASVLTTMTAFTAVNQSTGVSDLGTESDPAGAALNIFAAIPVITQQTLSNNTLANTNARPLLKFKMDAMGGPIGWDQLYFNITTDGATLIADSSTAGVTLFDVTGGGNTSVAGTFTNSTDIRVGGVASAAGTVKFVPTAEQQVSTTKTYELRGNVTAANATGDFVTATIRNVVTSVVASDAVAALSATAPIIWSDLSASSHDTTTTDWTTDFGVKSLPISDSLNFP